MLTRAGSLAHLDLLPQHRQPAARRVVLATVASIIASLVADAILVVVGEAIMPTTAGYGHFRFANYATLTVIGVIIAGAAWPIVTRVTSTPRWLFSRLAVVVTLVLWIPDVYLLYRSQPTDAVAILMVMHVAIAALTYQLLVTVASVGPPALPAQHRRTRS